MDKFKVGQYVKLYDGSIEQVVGYDTTYNMFFVFCRGAMIHLYGDEEIIADIG